MNTKSNKCEGKVKGFHVDHVAEDYVVGSRRPVLHCSEDVQRMYETNRRAQIISQIVGTSDYLTRDFMSNFISDKNTKLPQFATSHKFQTENRRKQTIPAYPSLVQSLRWNPYVEVSSSADNSKTNLLEDKPRYGTCRCETCESKNCPSRVSSSTNFWPGVFKSNIMTFSDRYTMTPKLNDACCGVCTPIPTSPATSDVCVPPDVAVRDTETVMQFPKYYQEGARMHVPERREQNDHACKFGYCGHATGHLPAGMRHEAVRDTDVGEDYCKPIKPKSLKSFFKSVKRKPVLEGPHCLPKYGRKIIYNEGICDKIATSPLPPIRVPSPINVQRECSRSCFKSKNKNYVESNNEIPFAHRTESRYHHSCKKPVVGPVYQKDDNVTSFVERPVVFRKTYPSSPVQAYKNLVTSRPRKVLTSEADIESYIEQRDECTKVEKDRRKKSKKIICFVESV